MGKTIDIAGRKIGYGCPVYVIAEAGVNHNGDLKTAKRLIDEARACGADCVKFQTFRAENVVTRKAPKAKYQLDTTDRAESQLDMLRKLQLKPGDYEALKAHAENANITFLSTPYNFEDIDLLESVGIPAYKVASGQVVELPFLRKISMTGKPVLLSTGMATLAEIDEALRTILKEGNEQVVLLQCTTNYPSRMQDANLRVMETFRVAFGVMAGYSDHTVGDETAIAAVALGALVVEKHFTLDKNMAGPDHSSSATPGELKSLVEKIRSVETALGSARKEPTEIERENATGMRRSIVACRDIRRGETITEDNITFKRPASGLSPSLYDAVIGKRAAIDISADELLQMDMIVWG
jgi:N-acetylneuraminate synthase/N,N'-diacetyllegionaminate synthase